MTSKLFSQIHEADLSHKNMEILKTEDIKEEALDIVDLSVTVSSDMKYEENAEEDNNIKIEINDIQDEGELELSYEQLKSIKIGDAFHERDNECIEDTSINSCISLDKLEPDNGKCVKDIEIIKLETKEGIDTFDDMETQNTVLLREHNYCKYRAGDIMRHCNYENNSQRHLKFNTQEPGLSYRNMAVVKNEDIKEEVTDTVDLSSVKVRSDTINAGHITHEFDIPLESIKYEENIKEEISTSYDTEMNIKTEVIDIKDEENIDELNLNHEQAKSMKVKDEVHKRNCSNECLEHTSIESCIALDNKVDRDNIQYNKNMEMIRAESNEQKDSSNDIKVDLEKQNAFLRWEHNYCKYKTVDVKRHSKYTNIIQRHKFNLQQQESNLSYKNMDSIRTEDIKEEVIDTDDSSSTGRSDIQLNEVGLVSIKYEEIAEEKNAHQTEVKIKKEIDDIKADIDTEDHELSCEQIKSINIENAVYKRDCSNKCIEHPHTKCGVSLGRLEPERQNINNMKTLECVQNEEDASNDIEVSEYKNKIPQNTSLDHTYKEIHKQNVKYFKCNFCEYTANRIDYLTSHYRRRHNKNYKLYECPYCEHTLTTRRDLVRHCRGKHEKDAEWFQCYICDFKTKYKTSLVLHHRSKHDAAKFFYCALCDYKTKYKQCLSQHHRSRHDDAAEIFHCERCNFKTKYKQSLSQHYTIKHDDAAEIYQCELCDFKTKDKYYFLYRHRLKHDDAAEIFHCELCDYETRYKYHLLTHISVLHDPAKEIHCTLCDFKTKYKKSLFKHYKAKHEKEL